MDDRSTAAPVKISTADPEMEGCSMDNYSSAYEGSYGSQEDYDRDFDEGWNTGSDDKYADYEDDSGNGRIYSFPDLGMDICGVSSYEEARKEAERVMEEMEMDGFTFDPFTKKFTAPEDEPYYDDGRPEGYHGFSPKSYRWKDMFNCHKQIGRRLTREETAMFEKNEPYETDLYGNRYDHKAIVEYAWKMKRPLEQREYDMFLVKDSNAADGGDNDGAQSQ